MDPTCFPGDSDGPRAAWRVASAGLPASWPPWVRSDPVPQGKSPFPGLLTSTTRGEEGAAPRTDVLPPASMLPGRPTPFPIPLLSRSHHYLSPGTSCLSSFPLYPTVPQCHSPEGHTPRALPPHDSLPRLPRPPGPHELPILFLPLFHSLSTLENLSLFLWNSSSTSGPKEGVEPSLLTSLPWTTPGPAP